MGEIKWNRNKITPGTGFMNKLVAYLNDEKIQNKIKNGRPNLEIIISDMYEVGEGEKKIVNYINKYLKNTGNNIMIYSPDADMILLCMLLPVNKLYMLRHNAESTKKENKNIYDLIDIKMLKNNIGYYINNNPQFSKGNFDMDKINKDIVCLSTLFGNDFVPKIETLNVKRGFQSIMDAYLKTLMNLKNHDNNYLVKKNGKYLLNLFFLKNILKNLLPEEEDFIKNNRLYAEFITIGQIKYVFKDIEITPKNLFVVYNDFMREYGNLKKK